MKKINVLISLAAGNSQLTLIKKAVECGYEVIGIDQNKNAIGFKFCIESIVCSTHDYKKIIEKLNNLKRDKYKFLGILNRSSGYPVITVSKISKFLNIKTYPFKTAKTAINKHIFFKLLEDLKIKTPKTLTINSFENSNLKVNYPVVVKPSISIVGKSGINKVTNENELFSAFRVAKKMSINKKVIIQEFVEGIDVALISFVNDGKIYPIEFVQEINTYIDNKIIGVGVISPAQIDDIQKKEIFDISNTLIKKLLINRSPFMISFRVSKSNIYPIELHLDFGGDLILDHLLPESNEIDPFEIGLRLMAGENKFLYNKNFKKHTAVIFHPGNELNSTKNFEIFSSNDVDLTMEKLQKKINELYK